MRGFTLGYEGQYRSGDVLVELMGGFGEEDHYDLHTATYYAERGKLTHLDEVSGYMGYTALAFACDKGDSEMVECLLAAGADTAKAADLGGWTPLIGAIRKDHMEVVRLLLSAGADTEKADRNGYTPLICATQRHHEEIIQLLQGKSQW